MQQPQETPLRLSGQGDTGQPDPYIHAVSTSATDGVTRLPVVNGPQRGLSPLAQMHARASRERRCVRGALAEVRGRL